MEPATLFYSYSHKDSELRSELDAHLALLKRQGLLSTWFDGQISPGTEWHSEIESKLSLADVILLLISSDFLASEFCWGFELSRAMQRHDSGGASVVPIILRPCDWKNGPFGKLQALPENGRAVTQWGNSDEAWLSVSQGLRQILEGRFRRTPSLSKREKWIVHIEAELDCLDAQRLSIIAEMLREMAGDAKLCIEKVSRGSVMVHLDISVEGAEKLLRQFGKGSLRSLAGLKILGLCKAGHEGELRKSLSARLLFLSSSSIDGTNLKLDKERHEIENRIFPSSSQRFQIIQSSVYSTEDLRLAILEHRPSILHFSGHGSYDGGIRLGNADGEYREVSGEVLRDILSTTGGPVRLVFLDACYTAKQAEAISQVADCVVGLENGVSDQAAISFSVAFYGAFADGKSLKDSFSLANISLRESGVADEENAKLKIRYGVNPSNITVRDFDFSKGVSRK